MTSKKKFLKKPKSRKESPTREETTVEKFKRLLNAYFNVSDVRAENYYLMHSSLRAHRNEEYQEHKEIQRRMDHDWKKRRRELEDFIHSDIGSFFQEGEVIQTHFLDFPNVRGADYGGRDAYGTFVLNEVGNYDEWSRSATRKWYNEIVPRINIAENIERLRRDSRKRQEPKLPDVVWLTIAGKVKTLAGSSILELDDLPAQNLSLFQTVSQSIIDILQSCDEYGLTHEEIAERLGKVDAHQPSRYTRALRKLGILENGRGLGWYISGNPPKRRRPPKNRQ